MVGASESDSRGASNFKQNCFHVSWAPRNPAIHHVRFHLMPQTRNYAHRLDCSVIVNFSLSLSLSLCKSLFTILIYSPENWYTVNSKEKHKQQIYFIRAKGAMFIMKKMFEIYSDIARVINLRIIILLPHLCLHLMVYFLLHNVVACFTDSSWSRIITMTVFVWSIG